MKVTLKETHVKQKFTEKKKKKKGPKRRKVVVKGVQHKKKKKNLGQHPTQAGPCGLNTAGRPKETENQNSSHD